MGSSHGIILISDFSLFFLNSNFLDLVGLNLIYIKVIRFFAS